MNNIKETKEGVTINCPGCGSKLCYDPKCKKFICSTCKNELTLKELKSKKSSIEKNTIADKKSKDYICPNCGAKVDAEKNSATGFCGYCKSPVILSGRISGTDKPTYIVPFQIDKEEAFKAIKEYLNQFSYAPKAFKKKSNLAKISSYYYPAWNSNFKTNSSYTFKAYNESSYRRGDYIYTTRKYYDVVREGDMNFENISVFASKDDATELIENVLFYPKNDYEEFAQEYLSGYNSKINEYTYQEVDNKTKQKLDKFAKNAMLETVRNYDSISCNNYSNQVLSEEHNNVMLPVWVADFKFGKKTYKFMINGVTGKCCGQVPYSKGLVFRNSLFVSAGIFASIVFLGVLVNVL